MNRAILLVAFVTGCNAGDGGFPELGAFDAGPDEAGTEGCEDGGPCGDTPEAAARCAELVAACCGETCAESAACAAAQLLQQYEPDRCASALEDTQTYPRCELGNCDSLVTKVCGAENACPDAPGCAAAQELEARSGDPDATQQEIDEASSACLQALEDESVFARCE